MKLKTWLLPLATIAILGLSACSNADQHSPEETSETAATSKMSTAPSETSSTAKSTAPKPTQKSEPAPAPEPAHEDEPAVIGHTEAPSIGVPHELDKTIDHCGDPQLHQFGTTFFTDGTSGWTETCSSDMRARFVPQTYPAPPTEDTWEDLDDFYDELDELDDF